MSQPTNNATYHGVKVPAITEVSAPKKAAAVTLVFAEAVFLPWEYSIAIFFGFNPTQNNNRELRKDYTTRKDLLNCYTKNRMYRKASGRSHYRRSHRSCRLMM